MVQQRHKYISHCVYSSIQSLSLRVNGHYPAGPGLADTTFYWS